MNRSSFLAVASLIVLAVLAGGLVSAGLFQWEQATRATAESGALPASPALAATPTPVAAPATSIPPTIAAGAPSATAPAPAAASDPVAGQVVFAQLCDACHPGGSAGLGPALSGPAFEASYRDDEALATVIRQGLSGMPGFPESRISGAQLADLIAFVRVLGGSKQGAGPRLTEVPVLGQLTWTGSYARDIQPIFDEYCTRCHGATLAENGLRLDTYEGVMQGTRGGAIVAPGSASGSTLVWLIQGLAAPQIRMPHAERPLSPNRIQNIILWIDAGAPND